MSPRTGRGVLAVAFALFLPMRVGAESVNISPDELTSRLAGTRAAVFYGGLMIEAGKTFAGPIVVVGGALDIQDGGVLRGDAWIVNGRLVLTGGARVEGRVDMVNGAVALSRRASVSNGVYRYRSECQLDAEEFESSGTLRFIKKENPYAIHTRFDLRLADRTRVRYDLLKAGIVHENELRPDPHVTFEIFAQVPVDPDTPRGFLGFGGEARMPLSGWTLDLTLRGYKQTESEDFWQVGRMENSTMLTVTTNEFADWYEKRGGEVQLGWRPDPYVEVAATGFYQQDVTLRNTRVWTVFGDRGDLPENPAVDDGRRGGMRLSLSYDSRDDDNYSGSAWHLFTNLETGRLVPDSTDGTDLDYTVFTLGAYRYNTLPWRSAIDFGGRLFSTFGDIPAQLSQSLGGWAGVRGCNDAPFAVRRGNRLVLLRAELRRELPQLPVLDWIYSRWDLVVFGDAGFLTNAECSSRPFRFLNTTVEQWKKSVGIGVSGDSFIPYLALYLAQELDTVGDRPSPRFILRMRKSF